MVKIVYNACYGGFGLSKEAIELYRTLSGKEFDYTEHKHSRSDPSLIKVIETLGEKANGEYSNLKICDLPIGTLYCIDDYDGIESVMTIDVYDWNIAK